MERLFLAYAALLSHFHRPTDAMIHCLTVCAAIEGGKSILDTDISTFTSQNFSSFFGYLPTNTKGKIDVHIVPRCTCGGEARSKYRPKLRYYHTLYVYA